MKKLITTILTVIFSFSFLMTFFKLPHFFASAEESLIEFSVIDKNYDGEFKAQFTPFNFETKAQMTGNSLTFSADANGQIERQLTLDQSYEFDSEKNLELGLWVFFSNKNLHTLSITLMGTNAGSSASVVFLLSPEKLATLLQKSALSTQDQEKDGYGWNYLELPFSSGVGSNLIAGESRAVFNAIKIEFKSQNINSETEYAKLYFYNAQIKETNLSSETVYYGSKQPYRLFATNFDVENLNQIYVGDKLKLGYRSNVINYAIIGDKDIKNDLDYEFRVKIIGDSNKTLGYEEEFTFTKPGDYKIQCELIKDGAVVCAEIKEFFVANFSPVIFNSYSSSLSLNKTYCYAYNINSDFLSEPLLHFEINNDCAKIEDVDEINHKVYIKALKAGNFKLQISGTGSRLYDDVVSVEIVKEFSVTEPDGENNKALKIILFVILGIGTVGFVGFIIKAVISANKYEVR